MKSKWCKFLLLLFLSIIVISGLIICAFANLNGKKDISPDDACKLWIESMEKQDMEGAVRAAISIVGDVEISSSPNSPIYESCLKTSKDLGINKYFFQTKSFNILDFQIWDSAFSFKKIADGIEAQDSEGKAKAIYELVSSHIKNGENGKLDWPMEILERGTGSCDRQAWVCLNIAKQAELDAVLLIFHNPDTGESPHTVCLILGDNGQSFLLDTFTHKFSPCRISELKTSNSDLSLKLYSDSETYRKSLPFCDLVYCAEPQNFCMKNQELQKKLKATLGNKRIPIFATNQDTVFKSIEEKIKKSNDNKACPVAFWCYPIELTKIQLDALNPQHQMNPCSPLLENINN